MHPTTENNYHKEDGEGKVTIDDSPDISYWFLDTVETPLEMTMPGRPRDATTAQSTGKYKETTLEPSARFNDLEEKPRHDHQGVNGIHPKQQHEIPVGTRSHSSSGTASDNSVDAFCQPIRCKKSGAYDHGDAPLGPRKFDRKINCPGAECKHQKQWSLARTAQWNRLDRQL